MTEEPRTPEILNYFVLAEPRTKQITAAEYIDRKYKEGFRHIVIAAPTGCHGAGVRVIMADGTLKKVEDVRCGDRLMGPDSCGRNVLFCLGGGAMLYRIKPKNGIPFTVNDTHVLSLQRTNDGTSKAGEIVNITLHDYLGKSATFKHIHKLWRPKSVRFRKQKSPLIDPYVLGLWLGDGNSDSPCLTSADQEIDEVWEKYVTWHGLKLRRERKLGSRAQGLNCTTGKRGGDFKSRAKNLILEHLRSLGLIKNKHIPRNYRLGHATVRLKLLAGLIDSDGFLVNGCYEFSNKNEKLAKDVVFIARSCGFSVSFSQETKSCQTDASGVYCRVVISGDVSCIPCRVKRKQANVRRQKKSVLRTGFSVVPVGHDNFYGFSLSGDNLYLLEDFTVTHNSGKSAIGATACFWANSLVLEEAEEQNFEAGGYYLVTQKLLQEQLKRDFKDYVVEDPLVHCQSIKSATDYPCTQHGNCSVGMSRKVKCHKIKDGNCSYVIQKRAWVRATLSVTNYPYLFTEHWMVGNLPPRRVLVLDECHTLEKQILKFVEVTLNQETLGKWTPTIKKVPEFDNVLDFAGFLLNSYLPILWKRLEALSLFEPSDDSAKDHKLEMEKLELEGHYTKTLRGARLIQDDPDNWVFWQQEDKDKQVEALAKPLDAAPFAQSLIFGMGLVCVHMSAYPGSKKIYCESLGLNPEDVAWLNLNSTFPVKNREIYMTLIGSMSRRNREQTMPDMIEFIQKIMESYTTKGIIHCNSYELGRQMYQALKSTPQGWRLLFPQKSEERDAVFQKHKQATHGSIILSPSMTEGFDFAYDLARWQVIAKVPYPYLGDRQVAAKKDRNQDWYDLQAVMSVIQACGRIVRSDTDEGHTYILDSDFMGLWERQQSMFPKWWIDALVWPNKNSET